jgi:fusaric acid resistance family protein
MGKARVSRSGVARVFSAMVGLTAPIAVGAATGHLQAGMLASMGALAVSGAETAGGGTRQHASDLGYAVAAGCAALLVSSLIVGHGWFTVVGTVLTAGVAALLSGISRPIAYATIRFLTFLLITAGFGARPAGSLGSILLVFGAGGICASAISLVAAWAVAGKTVRDGSEPRPSQARPAPPLMWLLGRWRRGLRTVAGWQYLTRLTLCLTAAETVGLLWPQPKSYWIALTVALVVQRSFAAALTRAFERAVGTLAGVLIASAVSLWAFPTWSLILVIGALAGLRPILRNRNYALYATAMTLLIVLLLDLDQASSRSIMIYRLVDTAIGCAIAVTLGYLVWPRQHRTTTEASALQPINIV